MFTRNGSREKEGGEKLEIVGRQRTPRNQATRLCRPPGFRGGQTRVLHCAGRGWLRAGLPAKSKAGKLSGSPRGDGASGAEAAPTETGRRPWLQGRGREWRAARGLRW